MGISIGIVGVGIFGRHFIKHFQSHPDVTRVAVCDLEADRLAEWALGCAMARGRAALDA